MEFLAPGEGVGAGAFDQNKIVYYRIKKTKTAIGNTFDILGPLNQIKKHIIENWHV